MRTLDITDTVSETLSFAFQHWLTMLRVAWLPTLVLGVVIIATVMGLLLPVFQSIGASIDAGAVDTDPVKLFALLSQEFQQNRTALMAAGAVISILAALWLAMISVPIQRFVILGEEPVGYFHLRFDAPIIRYAIVALILQVAFTGFFLAVLYWLNGFTFFSETFPSIVDAIDKGKEPRTEDAMQMVRLVGLLLLFGALPLIYFSIKLILALPATAARGEMVLFASLTLTYGKFWAILGAYLLLTLALLAIAIAYGIATELITNLVGPDIGPLVMIVPEIIYQSFSYAAGLAFAAIVYRRLTEGSSAAGEV